MITIKAAINLNQDGDWLKWAGRGYQPDCDFPKDSVIGEAVNTSSNNFLSVKTESGKTFRVKHADYYEDRRPPGRPLKGDESTQKISIRLPKSLINWLDSLPGDRTENIIRLLKEKQ